MMSLMLDSVAQHIGVLFCSLLMFVFTVNFTQTQTQTQTQTHTHTHTHTHCYTILIRDRFSVVIAMTTDDGHIRPKHVVRHKNEHLQKSGTVCV
jgi:hypothetical protein